MSTRASRVGRRLVAHLGAPGDDIGRAGGEEAATPEHFDPIGEMASIPSGERGIARGAAGVLSAAA